MTLDSWPRQRQRRLPYRNVLLLAALSLLLHVAEPIYVKTNHEKTVQSLKFDIAVDTLSWDSDKLQEIDNLTNINFDDKKRFEESFDLMHYLGLEHISGLHLPVPLALVFVGFSGNGNFRVNVTYDDLRKWFEHVDHVLPHSRIALSELSCSEDGQCSKFKSGPRPKPLMSRVHLNFSCQILQINDKLVMEAFDQAIFAFSRPVDPEHEEGPQQVDMERMEAFVDYFIGSLGINMHPTILVLNPNWSATRPQYGYRTGFSDKEIAFLNRKSINAKIFSMVRSNRGVEPEIPKTSSSWSGHWQYRPAPDKFAKQDGKWSSEYWSRQVKDFLAKEEQYRKSLLKEAGREPGAAALAHAIRILSHPKRLHSSLLQTTLLMNPGSGIGNRYRTMLPIEDCLVPNWVSSGRWLMLDLTAWGSQWGPALGGEGVVHRSSVPSVQDFFQSVKDRKEVDLMEKETEADRKLREALDNQKTHTIASYANQHHHAYMQNAARMSGAPGSSPDREQQQIQLDWEARYRETLIQAELDVLETFALRHCHNVINPPAPCAEARESAHELKQRLQTMAASSSSVQPLAKDHNWDIFGHYAPEAHGPGVMSEELRARDLFLAELAAILSRSIRHVVTPPSATWHHTGYMHDTATPYARQVNFEIYVIRDLTRRSASTLSADFQIAEFKKQIEGLRLANQHFKYNVMQMQMNDDAALAVAFAAALRTSSLELPSSNPKEILSNEQVYVDSQVLAHELRKQRPSVERKVQSTHGFLEVPIFIFEMEREYAIMVDEHYNAKALEDMVIVVQNAMNMLEHPSGMMCNGALMSKPNTPLKEALAAVLQHLGGVLPPHLGYNPTRHRITHDWLWSVGYNALSATAHGPQYTDLQRDALFRSYVLDALDTSVEMVNMGLMQLERLSTHYATYTAVKEQKARLLKLIRSYQAIVKSWRDVTRYAYQLQFNDATEHIEELEALSRAFKLLAQEAHDALSPLECAVELGHHPGVWMPSRWILLTLLLVLIFAALFGFIWFQNRSKKPKLN